MAASRKQSASKRPDHGVSLAVLSTTVLPVIKAAATGPPASANGKLYGAITTHTIRLHHTAIARTETRQRIIGQRMIETVLSDKIISVQVEKVRRLLHLAQRFHPVFTHFQRQRCSNVINTFFDQRGDALKQTRTLDHRCCAPAWESSLRGCHGIVRVIDTREREVAENAALVNGGAPRIVACGDAVLAINIEGMGSA